MQREAFENLISEWLDGRDDVTRTKLDALVAESPELRSELDQWLRLDAVLHETTPRVDASVQWSRLRERISQSIDAAVAGDLRGDRVDELLHRGIDVEARVDWSKLRERISTSVRHEAHRRDVAQQSSIRRALALVTTAVAAAAMLVVYISPRGTAIPGGGTDRRSFVRLTVSPDSTRASRTDSQVRVVIADDAPGGALPTIAAAGEIFLMIDPIAATTIDLGAPGAPLGLQ